MFNSLQSHGLQHTRLPCPSLSPGVCSNSCPLSWWCYLTISSSAAPFSSCLLSFPASGSFPISQLFLPGGQSIGASASVLPMNVWGCFPLGSTGLISLQSKGLSRIIYLYQLALAALNLAGYSPWGRKVSDMTEQLSLSYAFTWTWY